MKTLLAKAEPAGARTAARTRFRLRVWHVLLGLLLFSLLAWGTLFLLIGLAAAALH